MNDTIRVGVVGVGKMGLSHLSIINTHPRVKVVGICDATSYVLDVMHKYTGVEPFGSHQALIERATPDAVVIATPSRTHGEIARVSLQKGIHTFVEKPFCLSVQEGKELVALAKKTRVITQVGYHYRFVGVFREVKRLLQSGVIGRVHNFRVEAYGPVVLQPKGTTWRTNKIEGGGCLYDYASHAVNLVNYLFGMPIGVGGVVTSSVFSKDVDDEVYGTMFFEGGMSGQLCINWSDDTHRKMSMRMEIWGENGRINADRQECQVYLRRKSASDIGLAEGWNVRYTTELTDPVRYYVRGEEYSAQLDHFIDCIETSAEENVSSFESALETDIVLDMLQRDASLGPRTRIGDYVQQAPARRTSARGGLLRWLSGKSASDKAT